MRRLLAAVVAPRLPVDRGRLNENARSALPQRGGPQSQRLQEDNRRHLPSLSQALQQAAEAQRGELFRNHRPVA